MLKNVPLTAYDVFAIFLPGAIILISVIVIYYSFFPPEIPIDLSHYSYMEWLIVIVSCYFSGFVAQASCSASRQDNCQDLELGPRLYYL